MHLKTFLCWFFFQELTLWYLWLPQRWFWGNQTDFPPMVGTTNMAIWNASELLWLRRNKNRKSSLVIPAFE